MDYYQLMKLVQKVPECKALFMALVELERMIQKKPTPDAAYFVAASVEITHLLRTLCQRTHEKTTPVDELVATSYFTGEVNAARVMALSPEEFLELKERIALWTKS